MNPLLFDVAGRTGADEGRATGSGTRWARRLRGLLASSRERLARVERRRRPR